MATYTPGQGNPGPIEWAEGVDAALPDASRLTTGTVADARLPVSAQAATLSATYASRPSSARITAQGLPTWVRKRVLAQLAHSPCRILCVGDSTTAGVYSDSYTSAIGTTNQGGPNSWPSQLAARLVAAGLPAEYSLCLPGHTGNDDSRWAIGGWGYAGYGAGSNGVLTSASAGLAATVTPGIAADTYIVHFMGDPGTGVFTAQATGGTLVSISTVLSAGGPGSATITASAVSAANVITLTNSSGTVFVTGVESYTAATPNKIRVMNAGVGGSTAAQWAATGWTNGISFIGGMAPDLTIISLGINDAAASETTATVLTAVEAIATAAAASGDVLLMSAIPHSTAGLVDQYNAAYYGTTYPYVDLQLRYGNSAQAMGLITTDGTHPNAMGYGDIAAAVAEALLSA